MPEFFDRTIVCNTCPIIGLSRVGLSHLMGAMFAKVLLPETVVTELRAKHAGDIRLRMQITRSFALPRAAERGRARTASEKV